MDFNDGGIFVHQVSQSSLINEKQMLDPNLMQNKSYVGQLKVVDFLFGGDCILRHHCRLVDPDIDKLRERNMTRFMDLSMLFI